MKGSRPTRDQARGEMTAAAQVHGRPLMQLNQLCRWYLSAFVLCLIGVGLIQGAGPLLTVFGSADYESNTPLQVALPLIFGSIYFFGGAIGIRFLPTILGSSPHLHSLNMGLWSFWLGVAGTVGMLGFPMIGTVLGVGSMSVLAGASQWGLALSGGCWLAGSLLLALNFWKTLQAGY